MAANLEGWTRDIGDWRIHGTTGEPPTDRFLRDEVHALNGIPPFTTLRDLMRSVVANSAVAVDGSQLGRGP